jgi:hypothetical protein
MELGEINGFGVFRNLKDASFRTGRCDRFNNLPAKRESVRIKKPWLLFLIPFYW